MIATLFALIAIQATSDSPPLPATIEEAWNIVQSDRSCKRSKYPRLAMTMYFCEEKLTVWYFTVPDDELPPGFVRRMLVIEGGKTYMLTDSKYFGTDAQESAFIAWQAEIARAIQ